MAKLEGTGFGAFTKLNAAGWVPRKVSIGLGDGVSGGEAANALKNSRNSAPVRAGKCGVECAMISVCT